MASSYVLVMFCPYQYSLEGEKGMRYSVDFIQTALEIIDCYIYEVFITDGSNRRSKEFLTSYNHMSIGEPILK